MKDFDVDIEIHEKRWTDGRKRPMSREDIRTLRRKSSRASLEFSVAAVGCLCLLLLYLLGGFLLLCVLAM